MSFLIHAIKWASENIIIINKVNILMFVPTKTQRDGGNHKETVIWHQNYVSVVTVLNKCTIFETVVTFYVYQTLIFFFFFSESFSFQMMELALTRIKRNA